MLRILTGRSGTGKTTYLQNYFAQLAKNGNSKLLFIVPDQMSFDTEKVFLELLGPKLCRNVLVVGFSRLCDYVEEKSDKSSAAVLDDGEKYIIMSMAVEQVQDSLSLYANQVKNKELVTLMLSAEKEYKKCAITPSQLFEKSENTSDEVLKQKLRETALVCQAYDAIIENKYIDPIDRLSKTAKILSENKMFSDYTVAVDGFSGFTVIEQNALQQLMIQSVDFYCALTDDPLISEEQDKIFFTTKRTAKVLKNIAKKNDIKIAPSINFDKNYRFKSKDLENIENSIYCIDSQPLDYIPTDFQIYSASTVYDESEFVAKTIRRLIIEEDYRYNDFAVVCRDLSVYSSILDTIFDKYEISYFMDVAQNIAIKPLVKLVDSCFDAVTANFEREAVLSILKTGLTDFDAKEIADFENYLFVWNITGSRFCSEFTDNPKGFSNAFTESDKKALAKLEQIRKSIISTLLEFKEKITDATGEEITKALYSLLLELNVPENLKSLADELENDNQYDLSREQIRLWAILMNALDKMYKILGDSIISAKRYRELLSLRLNNEELATIPRGLDQVTVGTADRIRLTNKKAVFVIGAVDGVFPRTPVQSGIFTDRQRRMIIDELGLPLSDCISELAKQETYLAYCAMSSASQKLYLSYYNTNLKGEEEKPSSLVKECSRLFKNLLPYCKSVSVLDNIWCEKSAFEYCASLYSTGTDEAKELKKLFSENEKYKNVLESIDRAINEKPFEIHDKETAMNLFGRQLNISASQVEKYNLCKFQYFCQYGLKAKERRKAEIDSLQYGTIVHFVLESYLKSTEKSVLQSITKNETREIISSILEQYANENLGGLDNKSSRFLFMYEKLKDACVSLVMRISQELSQSEFVPVDFELNIGQDIKPYKIELPDNRSVTIYGSIDRVDKMEKNGKLYIRIIDYKTGTKVFDLSDIMYGLNLQMLIYLSAVQKNGKERYADEIIPAGVLYMPSVSPVINASKDIQQEKLDGEIDKCYRMNGLILNDMDVIKGMERECQGRYIPVVNKKGEVYLNSANAASIELLGAIFKRIDSIVTDMADNLHSGNVEALPLKGTKNSCEYCPYITVCGYTDEKKFIKAIKYDRQAVIDDLFNEQKEKEQVQ